MFPSLYECVWQWEDVNTRDAGWYSKVEFTPFPFSHLHRMNSK